MALIVSDQSGITYAQNSIGLVKEIMIVIRSDEEGGHGDAAPIPRKMKEFDVKNESAGGDGEKFERVCRICQLSSQVLFETSNGNCKREMDLIQLGCGCKEEMGISHSHCAETWFKLKGNRVCEICGEAAKNITGNRDQMLVEEWNEVRFNVITGSEGSEGYWRGKPLCNFLMACLILAFVVPWFFRLTWFK